MYSHESDDQRLRFFLKIYIFQLQIEVKLIQYTSILYLFSLLVGISYESHFMLFPGLLKFSFLCIVEEGVEVHSVLQIQASVLQNKEQLSHYWTLGSKA